MFSNLKTLVANLNEVDTTNYKAVILTRKALKEIRDEAQSCREKVNEASKLSRVSKKEKKVEQPVGEESKEETSYSEEE